MSNHKRRKIPVKKTPVFTEKKHAPFFALPRCPECGRVVLYGRILAKPMFFSESCRCGAKLRLRPSWASLVLWLVTVMICMGIIRLIIMVSTDMIPVYFFTVLFVIAAFFLYPLTVRTGDKKDKKIKEIKNTSHLREKNEK